MRLRNSGSVRIKCRSFLIFPHVSAMCFPNSSGPVVFLRYSKESEDVIKPSPLEAELIAEDVTDTCSKVAFRTTDDLPYRLFARAIAEATQLCRLLLMAAYASELWGSKQSTRFAIDWLPIFQLSNGFGPFEQVPVRGHRRL